MNKISNFFSSLIDKVRTNRKTQIIFVILLAVILVVIIVLDTNFNNKEYNVSAINNDYIEKLENKLSSVLTQVEGAGKVIVIINVESEMETVLAYKTTTKETLDGVIVEQTPIMVNGKTVVLKELFPKIVGVLIVAEGGDNISVCTKLQQATVSLLNIQLKQIEILKMK